MYDVYKIRKDFPMLDGKKMQGKPLVFLDNASTTFKPRQVIDAINRYNTEMTSNSHRGDYDLCYFMDQEIEKTRKAVAKFVNSEVNEVVFTSGDTAGLNLIAYSYGLSSLKKGDGILISELEHASNTLPWYRLEELLGIEIYFVDIEGISITVENVKKAFKTHPNIKIVSFAHVSNVTGEVIDAKAIAKVAHDNGAILVLDGAQSVPHMKTDFKDLDVDFLTFSAHKMCGPTGIGALIGKYELLDKMPPFTLGGGMNVDFNNDGTYIPLEAPVKFEAGTLNLEGIMGFRAAVEYITSLGIENIEEHEKILHDYLINQIKDIEDIEVYNKDSQSIFTFNVKGVFPQDEATLLNSKGIAVRSGLHCAKMIDNVLKTIATVRMSTYLYTSKEDIDEFVKALKEKGDILDAYFHD